MSLFQSILLDSDGQAEEVGQGEFMTFREEEKATVMLYRVHCFYVEVYYCKQTNNITRLNPFRAKARLGLYFMHSVTQVLEKVCVILIKKGRVFFLHRPAIALKTAVLQRHNNAIHNCQKCCEIAVDNSWIII